MSVNITVSGKFAKHCSHPLLVDPQDAKKAEEKERRKLRLLQVRRESKKLAKKIRDEVNEEKRRELQKLQNIKERELECWRQHALDLKNEEYRSAIFQVGSAHEAARKENQERFAKQKQGSYKDFKKQMAARKCQPERVKFDCLPSCSCNNDNKPSVCTCTKAPDKSEAEETQKRKKYLSFSTTDSECEDEGYKEQTTIPQSSISLSSTSDSIMSSSDKNLSSKNLVFVPTKNKCLIKTPSVFLDVEVGSDDDVTISAPVEVKDKHCKYNRQFSSVIRLSPRKEEHKKETTSENSTQPSSTATTLSTDTTARDQNKQNKSIAEKSENIPLNTANVPKEKRFTIISELLKRQQDSKPATPAPKNSQTTSAAAATHASPRKQIEVINRPPIKLPAAQSPRKTSGTSKSSRTLTTQPLSSVTTTGKGNSAAPSSSSCAGRVQFYDYNSKLTREQDQAATAVTIQRQRDQTQPSAMQQAELENQKERERQLLELKKLQQIEERGQKALEREQIRRDCKELTDKLEVLSQEYAKQLPTNDKQQHIFADKQLRKEGKMNSAIEKLLQRPSIITCSEQNNQNATDPEQKPTKNAVNAVNVLNVASLNDRQTTSPSDYVSSDSCCSILLGYVNDQSQLIKQDMQRSENSHSQSKQKRLKELLKRLDKLRTCLLDELKNESKMTGATLEKERAHDGPKADSLKQVIDGITELRREHEEIIINETDKNPKSLKGREKLLRAKEELLERKVREFFELQKQAKKVHDCDVLESKKPKTDKEKSEVCAGGENPLEIVITVKGDAPKSVTLPQPSRRKLSLKRTPNKVATLIKSPQAAHAKAKKHTPKKKPQIAPRTSSQGLLKRQNSYDSNSTSYMSLPPELPTKINGLAQAMATQASKRPQNTLPGNNQQEESESSLESLDIVQPPRVNPLIAQYVQRLLGMSRSAVQNLGVSSSELETPSSSIINTPDNIASSQNVISEERLRALQNFIEENKSFIEDVEQSIRSQNNVSLESSLRKLDDIWRKRLQNEKKCSRTSERRDKAAKDNTAPQKSDSGAPNHISKDSKIQKKAKVLPAKSHRHESTSASKENLLKDLSKSLSSHCSSEDKQPAKSLKSNERHSNTAADKAVNAKVSADSSKADSDSQIARYAKLTENCTHRIAELTELINRVRQEKQRLLEVTLSSVSDNGRHSTEYLDLPEGQTEPDDFTRASSSSEEAKQNKQSTSSNALPEMTQLTSADRNKQLANSRDSGIADSRPVTSLENRHDQEPLSQTSSESTLLPQAIRKMKPPPTLKRFSPQLPEEELPHELSTIFEVDTPATSRINTAIGGHSAEEKETVAIAGPQDPAQFPTFEQYIAELNLDLTQLNAQEGLQLQQEFTAFLECMQNTRSSAVSPKYAEFPSISSYIQRLAECDILAGDTLEESLAKLHLSAIRPDNFPAVREYIDQQASRLQHSATQQQQFLDTESLENITDGPTRTNTDNDTASVDIQEELKRRKIIKQPLRVAESSRRPEIFSSTAHKDAEYYRDIWVAESGIDKLSTSCNTSDLLDNDLRAMVQRWSKRTKTEMKTKQANFLSSTTTSINASSLASSALRAASANENSKKESGRSFNLRDFLIRELEKNASSSGSTSNDDSLRSHFLHSLLGSLTPYTPGAASKSGGQTLDRQKTSTPVITQSPRVHSTVSSHSNSSSQLFSGESRLSSVRYQNRAEHLITSEDANADQSSE